MYTIHRRLQEQTATSEPVSISELTHLCSNFPMSAFRSVDIVQNHSQRNAKYTSKIYIKNSFDMNNVER